jgi:hypothetical protein
MSSLISLKSAELIALATPAATEEMERRMTKRAKGGKFPILAVIEAVAKNGSKEGKALAKSEAKRLAALKAKTNAKAKPVAKTDAKAAGVAKPVAKAKPVATVDISTIIAEAVAAALAAAGVAGGSRSHWATKVGDDGDDDAKAVVEAASWRSFRSAAKAAGVEAQGSREAIMANISELGAWSAVADALA